MTRENNPRVTRGFPLVLSHGADAGQLDIENVRAIVTVSEFRRESHTLRLVPGNLRTVDGKHRGAVETIAQHGAAQVLFPLVSDDIGENFPFTPRQTLIFGGQFPAFPLFLHDPDVVIRHAHPALEGRMLENLRHTLADLERAHGIDRDNLTLASHENREKIDAGHFGTPWVCVATGTDSRGSGSIVKPPLENPYSLQGLFIPFGLGLGTLAQHITRIDRVKFFAGNFVKSGIVIHGETSKQRKAL